MHAGQEPLPEFQLQFVWPHQQRGQKFIDDRFGEQQQWIQQETKATAAAAAAADQQLQVWMGRAANEIR